MPRPVYALALSACVLLVACSEPAPVEKPVPGERANISSGELVSYTEEREACDNRNPKRNAYFGDLHIHTTYSYDARPLGTKTTPADAYRYARGEEIALPPYDESGQPFGMHRISRPLDFAAVTDHSEFLGEMTLCSDAGSAAYDSQTCQRFREGGAAGLLVFVRRLSPPEPQRDASVCGDDGAQCVNASISLWQRTRDMAEDAYDRSSRCEFTSFVAYEHTGTPNLNNYHRNVIFRNGNVPARPVSYLETPTDRKLWDRLTTDCLQGIAGCDVLAIPHNSNLASGSMFPSFIAGAESIDDAKAWAETRNVMEPVMEIFQAKGNSECFNGLPDILGEPDELCDFEQVRRHEGGAGSAWAPRANRFCEAGEVGRGGMINAGCISRNDFFRSVLLTGLQDQQFIGVNPYKFGAIGSTDTHASTAGAVDEARWQGHSAGKTSLSGRLTPGTALPTGLYSNPGGLAGVWAVENSRDALFEALQRREVFGTSGPRILPRLFGGWDYDESVCQSAELVETGYADGVPMGTDMPPRAAALRPRFIALALRDPEGSPLQRLQIIKGWIDGDDQAHYKVFDVAGTDGASGTINLETGEWNGSGHSSLCTVFADPDFDATQPSYYYLRAVEVPSLRWSWRQCVNLPVSDRPEQCDNNAPKVIQELAWTSPIWYLPENL